MKKTISLILCLVLILGSLALASCSKKQNNTEIKENNNKIKIVTTIFPIYDWVKNITGDNENAQVDMLIDSGADLHSFQPSADDIINIQTCDLFIYVGGESDEWAKDAVENANNNNLRSINLLEALGSNAKEEELVEGMQGEEEEEGEEEGEEEEAEYDEHIWLSVKNAEILVKTITDELCKLDSKNSQAYTASSNEYIKSLEALDREYEDCVNNAKSKTLLFGDRFPFRYLTEDYSIDYYAAFIGCSAETEASFETISFLANKTDELNLKYIITLEGTDHRIAQTIIENTKNKNQEILTMNSMQSITAKDVDSDVTYLSIMQNNLDVLKKALN